VAISKASVNDILKICEILGNEGVWKGRGTNIKIHWKLFPWAACLVKQNGKSQ